MSGVGVCVGCLMVVRGLWCVRVLLCVRCLMVVRCLGLVDGSGARLGLGVWGVFVAV